VKIRGRFAFVLTENWFQELMYIELHARSAFSFLEGTSLPEDLVAACTAFHMPAMALQDRDGVYGSPRFHLAAERAGIKAHIGAEISCEKHAPQRHREKASSSVSLCSGFRVPLLAASRSGYQNLCRLITKMKLRAAKNEGTVREDELQEHAAGLVCLTGDDKGPLADALARGGIEAGRRTV